MLSLPLHIFFVPRSLISDAFLIPKSIIASGYFLLINNRLSSVFLSDIILHNWLAKLYVMLIYVFLKGQENSLIVLNY